MTDEQQRLSRQKAKRTVMGAFLGLLVLGGAAFFLTSNNGPDDDTLVPQQAQPAPGAMDNDITDLRPATTPDSPPPIPLEDGVLPPNAAERDPPMLPQN